MRSGHELCARHWKPTKPEMSAATAATTAVVVVVVVAVAAAAVAVPARLLETIDTFSSLSLCDASLTWNNLLPVTRIEYLELSLRKKQAAGGINYEHSECPAKKKNPHCAAGVGDIRFRQARL
jgi:hypothetical protein